MEVGWLYERRFSPAAEMVLNKTKAVFSPELMKQSELMLVPERFQAASLSLRRKILVVAAVSREPWVDRRDRAGPRK